MKKRVLIFTLLIVILLDNCMINSGPLPINYSTMFDVSYCFGESTELTKVTSPVNIEYYNSKGHMVFPGNPKIVLDRTVYRRVNAKSFEFVPKNQNGFCLEPTCPNPVYKELEMALNGIGTAYVKLYNQTYEYKPYALRLHVYSEHTLEGMKMDMEIQIMHELALSQPPKGLSKKVGLAVLFSVARNKHSSFVEDFIKERDDTIDESERYEFGPTKSLDLNQFFNFWEPFYYYKGSGTSPSEYCDEVDWFVMKKVENMSQEQLRRILLILANNGYHNGNAKPVEQPTEDLKVHYCPNVEPDDE